MIILKFFIVVLILIKIYYVAKKRWCTSKVCLNGKTVLVTGANTGIGYETALEFAKRGARVILACRDLKKAAEAKDKIISLTENKNVVVKELNLASLKSVKKIALDIIENEERLDILVNNAGVGAINNKLTEDGLQIQMQINYFAPVLLTIYLVDLLRRTGNSRIINVSSCLAYFANVTADTINKYGESPVKTYSNSKLGNIIFTRKLASLLKGSTVSVYSLHPGEIQTDIFRHFKGWHKFVLFIVKTSYFKTPEEGAQTTLYTALEQGLEKYSGQFFIECQKRPFYKTATDDSLNEEVWQATVKLLDCEKEVEKLFPKIS